jgi:hypothetical protein
MHDDIWSVPDDSLYESGVIIVFNAGEVGTTQTPARWMHIDTHDVGKTFVPFQQ